MHHLRKPILLLLALVLFSGVARAQPVPHDDGMLYVMPLWLQYQTVNDAQFTAEVERLRTHFAEGGPVRVGFTVYLSISMDNWNVTNEAEAAANLATTVVALDTAIARARVHNLPIAFAFLTAIRDRTDPAQTTSQNEDRRVMQWYSDNALADGWWTLSRYARRQYQVRRLYLQAFARVLANRMARYPDTILAAAGDGEVELAFKNTGPPYADYSPFAIAEFRDWLRGEGLYAAGQPFAGEAYANAARYRGDASPGIDSNGDGHTLNGDLGTAFSSWQMRYFDWQLTAATSPDPQAIPASVYTDPAWNAFPDAGATLFDAPRDTVVATPWWQAWHAFREAMVWRYNRDFGKWLTTSPDPETGLTIPASRWFSYQIPADYLYGHSPETPDWRYLTSASSWRTADIRPYGGAGTTAFNSRVGGTFFRTLSSVAPLFAGLNTRWAILEWNPAVPATTDPAGYREEMTLIEAWRPLLVAPYAWQEPTSPVLGTGFETAVVEMIARLRASPWRLRATAQGSRVRVSWAPPDTGSVPDEYLLEVGSTRGSANILAMNVTGRSTILDAIGPPGTYYLRVRARRSGILSNASNEVRLDIAAGPAMPNAPVGLSAIASGNTFTFNWLAPTEGPRPTAYIIEAGSEPGLSNLATMRLSAATTFVINNVPFGSYYVRVRAEADGGQSGATNEVLVTSSTGVAHCTPVDPPGATAFRGSGSQVTFEWEPPLHGAAPSGYRLEAGSAPGLANIATVSLGTTRSLTVTAPTGTYYLQLRAIGACGTSVPGPVVKLTMP